MAQLTETDPVFDLDPKFKILKMHFCQGIKIWATKNLDLAETLWRNLAFEINKRPYHNLDLILSQTNILGRESIHVTSELAVALVMQYVKFNPMTRKSKQEAAEYTQFTLSDIFGWPDNAVQKVTNLILKTLSTSVPPQTEDFYVRIMHDMRLSNLVCTWETRLENLGKIKAEFPNMSVKDFTTYQLATMRYLQGKQRIFSLDCFNEKFNAMVRTTINKSVAYLSRPIELPLVENELSS